jgi:hypothetical protein
LAPLRIGRQQEVALPVGKTAAERRCTSSGLATDADQNDDGMAFFPSLFRFARFVSFVSL